MVNLLYAVGAFISAIVVFIMHNRAKSKLDTSDKFNKAYIFLTGWVTIFCCIDSFWGVTASEILISDKLLMIMSAAFHIGAAFTSYVWLHFVFSYIDTDIPYERFIRAFTLLLILVQAGLVISTFYTGNIFYVENNIYCTGFLRKYLFWMQYLVYFAIGAISIIRLFSASSTHSRRDSKVILTFVAAPICMGMFQLFYADAPAYSFGYMIGVVIIFSYIISNIVSQNAIAQERANVAIRQIEERKVYEAQLTEAKLAAEAASRSKTNFLFNMSHDIRTPMNAITGFTAIAKKHLDNPARVEDCLDKIDQAGSNLLMLINQVLEMSRIESGKIVLAENDTNIIERVNSIITMLQSNAEMKDIDLENRIENITNTLVTTDESRLNQVLTNIIGNAIKYTPEGGKVVCVTAQRPYTISGYVLYDFVIEDNGIGMSKEFLPHVFEEFTRENSSTASGIQGTGLGMPIVKKIVDLMDGTINIDSEPDKGTRVEITIPMKICESRSEETVEFSDYTVFEGKRLLLVEDNDLNREIAYEMLTETGFIIEEAEDGDIAVDMVKKAPAGYYDAVLMDVQMPRMNGYDATRAIRALSDKSISQVPIIAMTANAFEEDKRNALAAGMNEHVAKPINMAKLTKTLARFIK